MLGEEEEEAERRQSLTKPWVSVDRISAFVPEEGGRGRRAFITKSVSGCDTTCAGVVIATVLVFSPFRGGEFSDSGGGFKAGLMSQTLIFPSR